MKLTIFLLILCMQVHGNVFSQKLDLKVKNEKMEKVIDEISKKVGYNFLYDLRYLENARPITLDLKNTDLEEVLRQCFAGQAFSYQVLNKTIILRPIVPVAPGEAAEEKRIIVTGKVTDEKGVPLIGVSVMLKGSKTGISTNPDGVYRLDVPAEATYLVFSYLGFITKEVAVESRTTINVTLTEEKTALNEVVVVGYGSKTVRENIGAIGKVAGESLSAEPLPSFAQALAGKTAGVKISMNGGVLAEPTSIQIRGVNSISSSSQPLIVIDGVAQIPSDNLNGLRSGGGTRFDPLAMLNPNDIESVQILKDAASAVIYGSRASNGVILVTTKKGKKGSVSVNFDSKTGWTQITKKPPLLRAADYMMIQNEKAANKYGAASPNAVVALPSDLDGDGQSDDTDWADLLYGNGMMYDNTLSFSGGAEKLSVYGSARYLDQEGIVEPQRIKMGQGRLNLDFVPKTWFKSGISLAYTRTLNNGVLTDGYVQGVNISGWQSPSNVAAYNPAGPGGYNLTTGASGGYLDLGNNVSAIGGSSIWARTGLYNMAAMTDLTRNDNRAQDTRANIYAEIQPIKGLSFTTKLGIQYITNLEDQYTPNIIGFWGVPYNGLITYLNTDLSQWVWQNYATFTKNIAGSHNISIVGGAEYQKNKSQWYQAGAVNFADPFYDAIVDGAFTNIAPGQSITYDQTHGGLNSSALISYFGRASYTFNNKYLVEASMRTDAYSAFGENSQWGYFPSLSLGWEATKEDFLSDIKGLPYLKLRASYGQVGNSRVRNPYASRTLYAGSAYGTLSGFNINQVGNPDLKWESAKKTNIGIDATVGKNVGIVLDYFSNNIDNMILSAPVLAIVGVPNNSVFTNIGSMRNRGIEFTVNSPVIESKDFKWATSFNYTRLNNKVISLVASNDNADITSGNSVASIGKPLGEFKLIRWAGVNSANGNPRWLAADGSIKEYNLGKTGSAAWTDETGKPVSAISASADAVYTGKGGLAKWMGGWDNTFTFKQLELGINIIYSGGNYIYNSTLSTMLNNAVTNNFAGILDRWTTPGQQTDVPKLYLQDNQANIASTRFLEKGDFARVRTISLGYSLNRKLLDKVGFANAKIYMQSFNPFLITKYSGLDPDINTSARASTSSSSSASNIQMGIDALGTPQQRTFTLGINVSF